MEVKEIWESIEGYKGLYEVSNLGRVKRIKSNKERLLKVRKNRYGYIYFILSKNNIPKSKTVHRLVARAFLANPQNKPQVNHKNGIKTDNRLNNLEWLTISENHKHAYKIGLKYQEGENSGNPSLNEKQVRAVKHCLKLGMTNIDISKYFPVTHQQISCIKLGKSWKHVIL